MTITDVTTGNGVCHDEDLEPEPRTPGASS